MDLFNIVFQFAAYLPLVLSAYLLFLVFRYPDLTIEASWCLGGIMTCVLINDHILPPYIAFLIGGFTGIICGLLTSSLFILSGRAKLLAGLISYYILEAVGFHLLGEKATIYVEENSLKNFGFQEHPIIALSIYLFLSIIIFVSISKWQKTDQGIKSRLIGENPKSALFHNFSINKYFTIGLVIGNFVVGLGGGLWGAYYASATNLQGIGLIIKAFIAILIGDAIVRKTGIAKRPIPFSAIIGTLIFVLIVQVSEALQIFVTKNYSWEWFKATDKQIIVAIILLGILNWRKKGVYKKEIVSDW